MFCRPSLCSIPNLEAQVTENRTAKISSWADVKRPFQDIVSFPIDRNLLIRFGTVEDLLADQRWSEAIGILQ